MYCPILAVQKCNLRLKIACSIGILRSHGVGVSNIIICTTSIVYCLTLAS